MRDFTLVSREKIPNIFIESYSTSLTEQRKTRGSKRLEPFIDDQVANMNPSKLLWRTISHSIPE